MRGYEVDGVVRLVFCDEVDAKELPAVERLRAWLKKEEDGETDVEDPGIVMLEVRGLPPTHCCAEVLLARPPSFDNPSTGIPHLLLNSTNSLRLSSLTDWVFSSCCLSSEFSVWRDWRVVMIAPGATSAGSRETEWRGEGRVEKSEGETGNEEEGESEACCCCSRRAESCHWSLSVMFSDSASSWRSSSPFSERSWGKGKVSSAARGKHDGAHLFQLGRE